MKTFKDLEQDKKDNFLISSLTEITKLLNLSGIVETSNNTVNYSNSALNDFVTEIGQKLGFRTNEQKIFIAGDGFCYTVNILGAENLLNEFLSAIKIDWSKKRTVFTDKYEWKVINRFMSLTGTGAKEYYKTLTPRELAEAFDSLDDFENDIDYNSIKQNLETAKNGLEIYKASNEGDYNFLKGKIKGLEGMIKLWSENLSYWETAKNVAEKTDYEAVREYKKRRELDRLINENEHIEFIYQQKRRYYLSKSDIYEVFTSNGIEPKSDINLFEVLQVANEIKTETREVFIRDADNNLTGKEDKKVYKDIDDYILKHQIKHKDLLTAFCDKYKKKDGMFKSISWKQQEVRKSEQSRITELNNKIELVIKNESIIKKYI